MVAAIRIGHRCKRRSSSCEKEVNNNTNNNTMMDRNNDNDTCPPPLSKRVRITPPPPPPEEVTTATKEEEEEKDTAAAKAVLSLKGNKYMSSSSVSLTTTMTTRTVNHHHTVLVPLQTQEAALALALATIATTTTQNNDSDNSSSINNNNTTRKKSVRFAETAPVVVSFSHFDDLTDVEEEHVRKAIWYSRKDFDDFCRDRVDTVRVWRSIAAGLRQQQQRRRSSAFLLLQQQQQQQKDLHPEQEQDWNHLDVESTHFFLSFFRTHHPELEEYYCLRGLEPYQSSRLNAQLHAQRLLHHQAVLTEQARQRIAALIVLNQNTNTTRQNNKRLLFRCDMERMRSKVEQLSRWALQRARELALLDEQEQIREQQSQQQQHHHQRRRTQQQQQQVDQAYQQQRRRRQQLQQQQQQMAECATTTTMSQGDQSTSFTSVPRIEAPFFLRRDSLHGLRYGSSSVPRPTLATTTESSS